MPEPKKKSDVDTSKTPSKILGELMKMNQATLSPCQKGVNKKLEERLHRRTKQRNILFIILGLIILIQVIKFALKRWLLIN